MYNIEDINGEFSLIYLLRISFAPYFKGYCRIINVIISYIIIMILRAYTIDLMETNTDMRHLH